jgi:hypothetical protein
MELMMQRQVHSQQAYTAGEAHRRNVHPITSGFILAGGDELGWIENTDVFSAATKLKFATLDQDGNLYAPDGQSLYLRIERVNGGGRIVAGSHPDAIARFRGLARHV